MTTRKFRPPLLHDHLDGSYPLMTILPELFRLSGKQYPFSGTFEEQHAQAKALFNNVQIDLVKKFSHTTGVMRSQGTLSLAAETYTRVRAEQGFKYCEATIAPQYLIDFKRFGVETFSELFAKDPKCAEGQIRSVMSALIAGIKRGEAQYPEIEVNLLFTVGREVDSATAVFLVETAAKCNRDYVVGIGLVCDEATHPPEKHILMFRRAKAYGMRITVHAGEWSHDQTQKPNPERDRPQLLKNIRTAIYDLGAHRIGHAIPLAYDPELVKIVTDREIGIEGCPGSNLASGLIANTGYLKIRDLFDAGVMYSMNPDDDLFLPNLEETLAICDAEYRFSESEMQRLEMNAWATRFGRRKRHKIFPEPQNP